MNTSTMPTRGRGHYLAMMSTKPAAPRPELPAIPFDDFVERNRTAWLRDAEATLTTLDWRAYAGGRTLHVLDARAIGAPPTGYLGFTASAHLHELAGELLPERRTTNPVAAVAVNVDAIVAGLQPVTITAVAEQVVKPFAGAMVAAVAAHELAHVVDAQVAGERMEPTATLRDVLDSLFDGRAYAGPHQTTSHGPAWTRAYAHLVTRAARLPHHDLWVSAFERDVRHVLPRDPGAYLDALHPELARFTADDLLADVLRTPAPTGFLALFDERDAAQPATEET